jgi:hypothetical protein
MQDHENPPQRIAWNKGKLIGAKPPLRPKHVWSIRTKLNLEGRARDLAMFNLAIDSKLRGCDIVSLKVEDVAPNGYAVERATVRQRKTGQPVRFELTEQTREAIDIYVRTTGRKPGAISIPKPAQSSWIHHYKAVRATGIGVDRQHWARRRSLRHAFIATDQGKPDLPSHREPACGPTFTGPSQNREHCALSWYRGRRRACHSRTGRCVNYQGRAASLCPSIVLAVE